MISCTDKTGFSSLDFLSNETIDNCYAFTKMAQQEITDLSNGWRDVLSKVSSRHVIAGYVIYENNSKGDIVASSIGVAPGGFLYISNSYVMMFWSTDVTEIQWYKDNKVKCNIPISYILPTGYLSTPSSRLVGAPPTGICFINELILESYSGSLVPVGMLKCDRAIVNNGVPIAYFGCSVGNLPCEPIASGVVGARVAILKGARTFVQTFKKLKSNEGVYLSGTKRQLISEIYRRLSGGLAVDFSVVRQSNAPTSLSYSVASSLGMLQTRKEVLEGDTFFYFGSNLSNALTLINENDATLSDGVLSLGSEIADLLTKYESVVNSAKTELYKAAIKTANGIFDQVESLVNDLSSTIAEDMSFTFNDVSYVVPVTSPKINVEEVVKLKRADEGASSLSSELQSAVDKNKDYVNRVRFNDGSFRQAKDIQGILDAKIRGQIQSKAQEFLLNFNASLIQGQIVNLEHDTYSHNKSCDGTHFKNLPSVGHDEATFLVINNAAPYVALLNNHLMLKDGVITKVDALSDKEAFMDACMINSIRIEKNMTGYDLKFEFKMNLLQSCSPMFTLDRQIEFYKGFINNALSSTNNNAKLTFLGIEDSVLPTETKEIVCDSCGHSHKQFQALTNSAVAQPAYIQRYSITIPISLSKPTIQDIDFVGDFSSWYKETATSVQTQALLAGSCYLAAELCKLNLQDGLRFVGRVGGFFTSFKNLRVFSSVDAATVLTETINSLRDVVLVKDELGVFVVSEITREELNKAIAGAIQDAEKAGVFITFDNTSSKYKVARVSPVVQAWYCDSTSVISESTRNDDLLPILMSM